MKVSLDEVTVTLDAESFLSALWYSDGSGVRGGLGLETHLPKDFEVLAVTASKDGKWVMLTIRQRQEVSE